MFPILPSLRTVRLLLLVMAFNGFLCFPGFSLAEVRDRGGDPEKKVTVSFSRISLKKALDEIADKAGVVIIYSNSKELTGAMVSIDVKNKPLAEVLDELLAPFPLSYRLIGGKIVISHDGAKVKRPPAGRLLLIAIKGTVSDGQGKPLAGATVTLKGSGNAVTTAEDGGFVMADLPASGVLVFSFVGYQAREVSYDGDKPLKVRLIADVNPMNEVQVIGYGTTTKRLNTGSVATISARDIEDQPVTNVLSALEGRAAGLYVQTNNGLPGGDVSVQIRGAGSLSAGTTPLYIIDGVPFVTGYTTLESNQITGPVSPFNSLNPADIESISVLKDADATAIYGSRGANGVVLITTKKGKKGKVKTDLRLAQGISRVADLPRLLGLQDYLSIRREAFQNDGLVPSADPASAGYAPDLVVWNTKQSTDWARYMLGGTGHSTDLQADVSGGDEQTTFVLGASYRTESTVLPGTNNYDRGGFHMSIQHSSPDKKFNIRLTASYTQDHNQLVNPQIALSGDLLLPPDFPVYQGNGSFNFLNGINPVASLLNTDNVSTDNMVVNGLISYTILPGLQLKASAGLNNFLLKQVMVNPEAAQNPNYFPVSYTNFANNNIQSFIVEPQLTYSLKVKRSSFDVLVGGTWQKTGNTGETIYATNFNSESLLNNLASAATLYPNNSFTQYKYASVFGRVTYNWEEKYLLNVSVRRDGSSRFGPGDRYGNFGALGVGWLFSGENWVKNGLGWLSFGKLRASYGLTGNDQISDYQYLSTYSSSGYVYQNINGLAPSRIANNDFHWETNKKLEFGLELGLLKDRVFFTTDYFRNRSSNQLVNYAVPYITGFSSYEANLPAVIQNRGWEFELATKNIQGAGFSWSTNFNFSINKNTLKSFPGLATSGYSDFYSIGQSVSRATGFQYAGADLQTGVSLYPLKTGGTSSDPSFDNYYYTIGDNNPAFYGGMGNSFSYKNFRLDIFAQFAKHSLPGGLVTPGSLSNNFAIVLNRWQKPGDITNIPKPTTGTNDYYYTLSSANFFNASYLRLKNVALSYAFSQDWLRSVGIDGLKIFVQGENLLTFWNRNTALYDPESGASSNIPPLRTIIAGFQITL